MHDVKSFRSGFNAALFDDESRHLDRFGSLLFLSVVVIVVESLVDGRPAADSGVEAALSAGVTLSVGCTLALAVRAAGVRRKVRVVIDVFVIVAVVSALLLLLIDLVGDAQPGASGDGRPSLIWLVMSILTPIAVILRLVRHRRVSTGTLSGSIAAYLLIALAFHFAFLTVDGREPTPFFGHEEGTTSFMYFSLTTITTLGYGDLAPATNLGRLLSTSEALIGQIYLVVFVAMLVGLAIQNREKSTDEP
ncbi:MAG: hypothetical protein DRJ50_04335 [Actinobacteria bacterium]|nr:MAG: hypothetical protein DRJ50_04335 [Actinomycetota bacterium]